MLEEEPAPREGQTRNIQNGLLQRKTEKPKLERSRVFYFFKNLSGIEYGGAEEAKKDES